MAAYVNRKEVGDDVEIFKVDREDVSLIGDDLL
jgi:hypothetical protein